MSGAVLVAVAAAIGNLLQGWDNATIAGAVLYIKKEFHLESNPSMEGLIVAMSLIGATLITTWSGGVADWLGRRPMLILSSVLYFVGSLVMLWSPNVYVLLLGRLLDGFGVGLVVTLVPIYISETAPPEIRGLLNTLPQFAGSGGMFLSYCMVFGMSLMPSPSWRLMLGVLFVPSLVFFFLTIFFLPESPRWLVSKGRMLEAKRVLQRLRGREDVSGEMALLVEGLGTGGETTIEEYIIGPADDVADDLDIAVDKDQIKLYGAEEGLSWVARPVKGGSTLSVLSRHGSTMSRRQGSLVDPLVTLFGSVHEKMPETGSMRSALNEEWDEENLVGEGEDYPTDRGEDSDDDLHSPLISLQGAHGEGGGAGSMGIGGGWQVAWKWTEREDESGQKEGGFKRIYLHQEGFPGSRRGSIVSLPGGEGTEHTIGPAMVHPSETVKGSLWHDLQDPGVKRALFVGVGLQILQQFSGINGVLYYTPQILEQAGVGILLSNLGISSSSSSLLISALTTFVMLPAIAVAMRLMDLSGRRTLLLTTIPILIASLIVLVISNLVHMNSIVHAVLSTVSVVLYFCFFVMGFGPTPNILCSEIFPTRVRGICIAICALTFWICDIIVTYSLPVLLKSIGLAGVFGMYAVVCCISWAFVYLKVPETKGMPLEVITEFFSLGARQAEAEKNN
ncbi:BnaCnng48010D [Brassica napus]|uniref:BnaCnng48010D protein n=1 Tax=Brassica napus TaxID=3708 RepID=A0A078JDC1_BRANA|nr:BnaCnng48010D [Brassica napus]